MMAVPTHLAIMDVTPDKRGSFETYAVKLAEALEAAGWRSVQCVGGRPPGWLEAELRRAGAEVLVLSEQPEFEGRADWPAGLGRDMRMARLLGRLARVLRPDVVHLHFCVIFSILPLGLWLGGARNIVFTEHISLPIVRRPLARDLAARLRNGLCLRFVRRVLPVSGYVRRRLVESDHVPPAKATVIYNGVDLARFAPRRESPAELRARLGVPPPHHVVTCDGQRIDYKGINNLVDAAHVLRERPDLTVLVAGDGDRRAALEAQVGRLGLAGRVRILGQRDDVHDILGASDLFVCPSVWDEALGYVILEAMAAGVPVVASRVGVPEVVRRDRNSSCRRAMPGRSPRMRAPRRPAAPLADQRRGARRGDFDGAGDHDEWLSPRELAPAAARGPADLVDRLYEPATYPRSSSWPPWALAPGAPTGDRRQLPDGRSSRIPGQPGHGASSMQAAVGLVFDPGGDAAPLTAPGQSGARRSTARAPADSSCGSFLVAGRERLRHGRGFDSIVARASPTR
jgi:glycosyltransferase involved in cell wall biosynthesis